MVGGDEDRPVPLRFVEYLVPRAFRPAGLVVERDDPIGHGSNGLKAAWGRTSVESNHDFHAERASFSENFKASFPLLLRIQNYLTQ